MNDNLDSIFTNHTPETAPADAPFDKDAWAAKKQAQRSEAYALAERTAEAIAASGESFQGYLDTLSRFELYSPTNTLLIYAQNPAATRIGDFEHWKEAGESVRKGEKAMTILEPGPEYKRPDGEMAISFNTKAVFDIAQTSAKPTEPFKPRNIKALDSALVKASPVPIVPVDALPNGADNAAGAVFQPEQGQIEIMRGMDGASIFRCLSQEVALAQIDASGRDCQSPEFVAYAASYVLCQKYGVDAQSYNFSQAPEFFADKESTAVRSEVGAIRDTVADIAGTVGRELTAQKAPKAQERG
jgi:hypothetical protein